jgi:hypothetical protein
VRRVARTCGYSYEKVKKFMNDETIEHPEALAEAALKYFRKQAKK